MGKKSKINNPNPNAILGQASIERHYSGPIPPASEMAKYEEICQGAANRILTVMEQQIQHRHKIEFLVIKSSLRDQLLGVVFAFILSMMTLAIGWYCIYTDKNILGTLLAELALLGL